MESLTIRVRLLVLTLALMALSVPVWAALVYLAPVPSADSPRDTVVRYYRLVAQARDGEARGLTGPGTQASQWTDLSSEHGLIGLSVDTGSKTDTSDPIASGYVDPVVFRVSFVQFGGTDTQSPGSQTWFVAVGRTTRDSPWRIVQFASGW